MHRIINGNKKMTGNRRSRMNLGFGYIGSGNKTSIFTRQPKLPFKKVKEIYGEELERLNSKNDKQELSFKKLTENEKIEIRERIKKQIKKKQLKELMIMITIIIIALGAFTLANNFL